MGSSIAWLVTGLQNGSVTHAGINVLRRPYAEAGIPRWTKARDIHAPFFVWPNDARSWGDRSSALCEEDIVAHYDRLWPSSLPTTSPPGQRRANQVQLHLGTVGGDTDRVLWRALDSVSREIPTITPHVMQHYKANQLMTLVREPPDEALLLEYPPAPIAPSLKAPAPPKESPFRAARRKGSKELPLIKSTGPSNIEMVSVTSRLRQDDLIFAPSSSKRSSGLGAVERPILPQAMQGAYAEGSASKRIKRKE